MNKEIPLYIKIKENIKEKIKNGTYQKNMRLPSENVMSKELAISRMTVRRALDELTREGLLFRTRGSGTYVAANRFSQCDIMSFSEMVKKHGSIPESEILEKSFICDDEVSNAMHLPKSSVFFVIKRLRLADKVPVAIENVFLPLQYCISPDKILLEGSLYEELKRLYGLSVVKQDIAIIADIPTKEEKELLRLTKSDVVLKTNGISLDDENRPILYEKNIYSGKSYIMQVSVKSRWV